MENLNDFNKKKSHPNVLQTAAARWENWFDRKYVNLTSSTKSAGILLIAATVAALLCSNISIFAEWYEWLWNVPFVLSIGSYVVDFTFIELVNDGLMSIFFFAIGLEIKREFKYGHLSTWGQAALPVVAAIGGMLMPALIYAAFNSASLETSRGWGIPMATDIAFSLGIISMFSKKVPLSLKVFLATLAVADDLGSILVIAIFYSHGVNMVLIAFALLLALFMFFLNYLKIPKLSMYVIPSALIWILFLFSGVHVTIAGVLIAFAMPIEARVNPIHFIEKTFEKFKFDDSGRLINDTGKTDERTITDIFNTRVRNISKDVVKTISPLVRLEDSIKDFVNFVIMPIFAFANAGVVVNIAAISDIFSFEAIGIILGLVIGKPLGICLFSYVFIKCMKDVKPEGARLSSYLGVGFLGGIGFTMSIFIDTLAFAGHPELIATGKIAILLGSLISALIGTVILMSIKDVDQKYHW